MKKELAIKKISDKFSIPENEITELLQSTSLPKKIKVEPKTQVILKPKEQKHSAKSQGKRYLFIKSDYLLLIEKINSVMREIKRIGGEIGESCSESETFHDNFGYEEGERQQKMWIPHLKDIEKIKENAVIVSANQNTESIGIGNEIKIKMETGEMITKKIGSYITFSENEISYASPLAKLLMGKKIREKVKGEINGDLVSFEIEEIR
jgi:transcription elongation GreA/GreB family factor